MCVCWLSWLVSVHCVCALFDLRYPGVHQSGSGSGQHQRGGRWTLPRHEWERRALWVGESKRKKKKKTPFIHNPALAMQPRVSFTTSLALDTHHLLCRIHSSPALLRKSSCFFYNVHQCWFSKVSFHEESESPFVIKVPIHGRWENHSETKQVVCLLESHSLSHTSVSCCFSSVRPQRQ